MATIYDINDKRKDDLRALLPEVLQAYKQVPVKNVSRKYKVCCPYHSERTPSCEIDPKKGVFYCFGCGKGGDVFDIVAEEENLNLEDWRDFQKVAKIIADIGNIHLPEKLQDPDKDKEKPPTSTTRPPRNSTATPPPPPRRIRYIKPHEWQSAERFYRETALYHWLCGEYDRADVERVLEAYHFGGANLIAKNGYRAAFFPYIAVNGKCVDCKIFHLDPNTGSRKTADPVASWIDRKTGKTESSSTTNLLYLLMKEAERAGKIPKHSDTREYRADPCSFGDHLLPTNPDLPICVVESEKTALVAALTYPDRLWVAVGGKGRFNPQNHPEYVAPYRGRKIIIYPDRDGYDDEVRDNGGVTLGWRSIARLLAKEGFEVYIDTTIERHYSKYVLDVEGNIVYENGKPKASKKDLADLILEYKHGVIKPKKEQPYKSPQRIAAEQAFEEMKRNNPILAEFAEVFQLEPISVEYLEPVAVQSQTTAQKDDE